MHCIAALQLLVRNYHSSTFLFNSNSLGLVFLYFLFSWNCHKKHKESLTDDKGSFFSYRFCSRSTTSIESRWSTTTKGRIQIRLFFFQFNCYLWRALLFYVSPFDVYRTLSLEKFRRAFDRCWTRVFVVNCRFRATRLYSFSSESLSQLWELTFHFDRASTVSCLWFNICFFFGQELLAGLLNFPMENYLYNTCVRVITSFAEKTMRRIEFLF